MSKVKLIIQVRVGNVINVSSTQDINYVIVDYDNIDVGEEPVKDVYGQDAIFEPGEAHRLFTDASDPQEMEIKDALKVLKF